MTTDHLSNDVIFLTRYEDIKYVLNDVRFDIFKPLTVGSVTSHMKSKEVNSLRSHRIRPLLQVLTKHLSSYAVQPLAPLIETFVRNTLDKAQVEGKIDLIADLAYPLPMFVMAELMGLPPEELLKLEEPFATISRGHDLAATDQDKKRGHLALLATGRWLASLMRQRKPTPLMDAILLVARDGNVGESILHYWCTMLLYAGSATTKGALSNSIAILLENPELSNLLLEQPQLIDSATEEFLRFQGPVKGVARVAAEDVNLGDQIIQRGQLVYLMLNHANKDPLRFKNADQLDICRSPNPHVAFGYGVTYCLGAHLARLEIQQVLKTILPYLPKMSIAGDIKRSDYNLLCEYTSLPIIFS
jgi:pimeloyl-[acyl-carrier protein] synthase